MLFCPFADLCIRNTISRYCCHLSVMLVDRVGLSDPGQLFLFSCSFQSHGLLSPLFGCSTCTIFKPISTALLASTNQQNHFKTCRTVFIVLFFIFLISMQNLLNDFFWLLLKDKITTRDILQRKNMDLESLHATYASSKGLKPVLT
jgi:hypothetical protein